MHDALIIAVHNVTGKPGLPGVFDDTTPAIPEPASLGLPGLGLAALGTLRRRHIG